MKKKTNTPKSQITSALRRLWLRSRERAAALKRDDYACGMCGVKRSYKKAAPVKVVVHHRDLINWNRIEKVIREELLVHPNDLIVYCEKCHKEEHK